MAADDTSERGRASVALASRPQPPQVPTTAAASAIEPAAPARPPARSLTAAARRIDLTTRDGRKIVGKPTDRDKAIWTFIRTVPEANFAKRFMGNALSRVALYAGVVIDPAEAPMPVLEAVDDPEVRFPAQLALDAMAELERITTGPDGMAGMMRGFGENLLATGEAYLVGRAATDDDPVLDDEVWQVFSKSNVVPGRGADSILIKESPKDSGRVLAGDDLLYRIWRRDTEWPALADAGIGAVADELEELLIYSRQFRAIGKSRNPAGILLLPNELDPPAAQRAAPLGEGETVASPDPTDQSPIDGWTPFELSLMRSFIAPNEDDGSAASVVPHMLRGPAEHLKEVRHLLLDRQIDKEAIARMRFLIERIAHGVDLPVEVLTGIADANHWTGWQIEDSTWKAHVEPTAQIPAIGLTAVHMRPALRLGHPNEINWLRRLVLGVDPSRLVVRPNRSADAAKAHDAVVISDRAYRNHLGFPESDAPDEEERLRRYALEKSGIGQDITAQLINFLRLIPPESINVNPHEPLLIPGELGPAAAAAAEEAVADDTAPTDDTPDDSGGEDGGTPTPATDEGAAALTAAAVLPDLGDDLAAIETRLRDRLLIASSEAITRALRTAGNRLRGAIQGDQALRDEVNGAPADQVGIILGTDRAPVVDPDQLLAGAFDELEDTWTTWVDQAEAEAAAAVATALSVSATDARPEDTDTSASLGWTALRLGLLAYAAPRIFAAAAAEPGESDPTINIPAGLVRDALTVSGGGQSGRAPFGTASQSGPGGLFTGPRWRDNLARFDIVATGWTWHTGFPSVPFPPHRSLGGQTFDSWEASVLTNTGGFPATAHYYPGDHRGCQCWTTPTLVQLSQEAAA